MEAGKVPSGVIRWHSSRLSELFLLSAMVARARACSNGFLSAVENNIQRVEKFLKCL
jgi:hypothetical protein